MMVKLDPISEMNESTSVEGFTGINDNGMIKKGFINEPDPYMENEFRKEKIHIIGEARKIVLEYLFKKNFPVNHKNSLDLLDEILMNL